MNYWLLTIPVFTALTGWLTTRLMVRLVFHPRKPSRFLGIKIQGILPQQQEPMAGKLGSFVEKEFISSVNIEQRVSDPVNLEKILPVIEEHVDGFLRDRLKTEMPMISMFIGDKTITKMKTALMKEIQTLFPTVMSRFAGNLVDQLDIKGLVEKKIRTLSMDDIEQQFYSGAGKEVKMAGLAAAVIGFVIGLIPVIILLVI